MNGLAAIHGRGYTSVRLPAQAPGGALLSIRGNQRSDIELRQAGETLNCPVGVACAYVFDGGERRWRERSGRVEVSTAQVDLPMPAHRWTTLVVGSPAEDLHTPAMLRLPTGGVDGDIYQVDKSSGDDFAQILTDNTSLFESVPVSMGPHTFRFDASRRTWTEQPK